MRLSAVRNWLPFTVNYLSWRNAPGPGPCNSGRVLGVGWRRWAIFLHLPGAYGRSGYHLAWCDYYGTGDGGV